VASAQRQRYWAFGTMGLGVLLGAAGGIYYALNEQDVNDAEEAYDEIVYVSEEHSGRACDVFDPDIDRAACESALDSRWNELEDKKSNRLFGYIGMGTGAALIGTGVVLLIISDSPSKYDRPRKSALLEPSVSISRDYSSVSLSGSF